MATDKQKWFIRRNWRKVCTTLSLEEKCAVELMGEDSWIEGALTKRKASDIIGCIKNPPPPTKEEIKRHELSAVQMRDMSNGVCVCGGKMERVGYGLKCFSCGEDFFLVGVRKCGERVQSVR